MKILVSGTFNNYSIKKDGLFVLKMKFPATELPNAIKFVGFLNKQMKAKITAGSQSLVLTSLGYKNMRIDREGEVTLEIEGDIIQNGDINIAYMLEKSITVAVKEDVGEESEGESEDE